eukprot:jgi/Psemu1/35086/gm1.35086_g
MVVVGLEALLRRQNGAKTPPVTREGEESRREQHLLYSLLARMELASGSSGKNAVVFSTTTHRKLRQSLATKSYTRCRSGISSTMHDGHLEKANTFVEAPNDDHFDNGSGRWGEAIRLSETSCAFYRIASCSNGRGGSSANAVGCERGIKIAQDHDKHVLELALGATSSESTEARRLST